MISEETMFLWCNIIGMIICIIGMIQVIHDYRQSIRNHHMWQLLQPLLQLFRYKRLIVHRSDLLYDEECGEIEHTSGPIKCVQHFDKFTALVED